MALKKTKAWTVEYMVRERKGDYLAAVEQLEASHKVLVAALRDAEVGLTELVVYLRRDGHNPELALARLESVRAALAAAEEVA